MVPLIRVARVLAILALALVAISMVIGAAAPQTGLIEKLVLAALFGGCVFLAAQVTAFASRLERAVGNH